MQIGNVCCQSTPNQKENNRINSQFNLSKRTERKSINFVTPDKKINLKFSPNSSLLWNLNRRKAAAEKNNKILMEEKLKEKENEEVVDFNEVAKSLEDKLRKYALENLKGGNKNKIIEKPTEIPVKIQDLPQKNSMSPDIRAAFLARKAQIQENQKLENRENSPPDTNINVSLENNIRAYSLLLKNVLSGQKVEKTPKSIKQTNNTNSSFKSTPAAVNKNKSEFVTPLTSSVRTKKIVATPTRWK